MTGSGKQSIARLASFIVGLKCQESEGAQGYGVAEFREDLKRLYRLAGLENAASVFLFNDTQISDESFLEDFSCILNTGEVPNLFTLEEQDQIVTDVKNTTPPDHLPGSSEGVFKFFLKKARANLHLVLCMSPVGDALRTRCRNFPSLINCTTIDWYLPWPKDALLDVALRAVAGELLDQQPDARGGALASRDRPRTTEQDREAQLRYAERAL